jgi:lactate permease
MGKSKMKIRIRKRIKSKIKRMIDAQSIVVSAAATQQPGQEGAILRFVFWHSLILAALMGLLVMAQAYLLTWMIP